MTPTIGSPAPKTRLVASRATNTTQWEIGLWLLAPISYVAYVYDANNRVVREYNALGINKFFGYDAKGNELTVTDERGNTTTTVYDANDRIVRQTDALLGVQTFSYDANGNLLSQTDERRTHPLHLRRVVPAENRNRPSAGGQELQL